MKTYKDLSDYTVVDGNKVLDVYGIVEESIVDGPGLRYAIFVQGCTHNCPGCHNQASQPFGIGKKVTIADIISSLPYKNPMIKGVTISGGEPFDQAPAVLALVKNLKALGYNIWIYSGYVYNDLINNDIRKEILDYCDVLVDGPFVEKFHDSDLEWRGSANQHIIYLNKDE